MDWNLATLLKPPDKIPKNWDSNKSYLERQYKLLLEDFVQPLRDALSELQNNPTSPNISNLKFLGSYKISQQVSHKFLGYQLISIGNSCDELPLPGSLVVLVPETCRSRVQDPGIVLTKAELDVPKEGQKAEFRISILSEDIENSLVYKVYEYSVYLEAYIHHLKVLANSENVPLSKYVVDADTQIEQPEYLKKTKFPITFNSLKKNRSYNAQTTPLTVNEVYTLLMKKKDDKFETNIDIEKCEEINFEDLDNYELLDDSQNKSIKCCLSQEISLVQGPPGTGKSLIGTTLVQLLLENKHVWCEKSNYPILVICYTNSALDQFLEGLLPYTQKVVRLGGRSRSTVIESHTVSNIRQYMKDSQLRNQNLYTQERELYSKMSQLTLNAQESQENIKDLMKRYSEELESLIVQETKSLFRRADILGVTSTGAAKYFNIINDLQPRIVLVEEAGEILESHMQACIPASTQQLILIGDHMQLRPQVASYALAREEKHDISLFERLINSGLPYSQLNTQHRMVPEISKLLLPVYPDLKNHLAVTKRTKVPGISKSLFFLDHSFAEDQTMSGSKVNTQEGELARNLAKYFVEQGVEPSFITILTAYSGQLRLLKSLDVHPGKESSKIKYNPLTYLCNILVVLWLVVSTILRL